MLAISPLTAQVSPLPGGDPGVSRTIRKMRTLIDQGVKSATVRAQALEILNAYRVPAFDWMGQARAIYDWVLRNVTFTPDPRGKEGLQAAEWTLQYRRGDCDCFTILLCSLLGSVGMKTRIVTIAGVPEDPTQFSHVYPEVSVDGKWITVDAARRNPAFGVAPKKYFRRRAWSVDRDEWSDMQGYNPRRLPGAYRANTSPVWDKVRGTPFLGILPTANSVSFRRITPALAAARIEMARVNNVRRLRAAAGLRGPRLRGPRLRGLSGYTSLGDIDWGSIASVIQAGGQTTANIITASRAAPQNLFPTTGPNQRTPYGYSTYPSVDPFGGISPTTLLIGGGLLLAVVLGARR
jgi:hypothetical protein